MHEQDALKKKLFQEGFEPLSERIGQLKMASADGTFYAADCANTGTMFRMSSFALCPLPFALSAPLCPIRASPRLSAIPQQDRPREKLLARGAKALSDQGWLAILLGTGTTAMDLRTLAAKLAKVVDETGFSLQGEDLKQ